MGIINATPDSFHVGSRAGALPEALAIAERMVDQGVDILDVGGQSTRPGAAPVGASEEARRVIPVIDAIRNRWPMLTISVDTFHAAVAKEALDAGADIVNDIGAALLDPEMAGVIAEKGAPCILMHMQGTPQTMQNAPHYRDVTEEVLRFLEERLITLRGEGIQHIALDPGFGFGKSLVHNYQLLDALPRFAATGVPILVGVSRKSMIHKVLDCGPEAALNGTTALHAWALERGAHILRVHDVAEAAECVKLHQAMVDARKQGIDD